MDKFVEGTVHNLGEVLFGEFDAVVGNAVLGIVVGANFGGAVAGYDEATAEFGHLVDVSGLVHFYELDVEFLEGDFAVFDLGAAFLAFDDEARGAVGNANCGLCTVNVLATSAGGAENVPIEVGGVDFYVFDIDDGEDCDGSGGGMNAALCFGFGYALDAVGA